MFRKVCFFQLLIISSSCFAQVTIIGGAATTIGPSAAISPLIATPEIALPGSGSAVGAPLVSAAANDSRFSRSGMVYDPNGAEHALRARNSSDVGAVPRSEPQNAAAAERFEFGIQHFESGPVSVGAPPVSLGKIARNYRAQRHQATRTYTDDGIAQMSSEAGRIGNLEGEGRH